MTRRSELMWMTVPVLLLGVLGWALRGRGAAQVLPNEPFRLKVEKITPSPLTPREVFEGYDTKLVLTLGHSGAAPGWWDTGFNVYGYKPKGHVVAVNRSGQRRAVGIPVVSSPYRAPSGEWQTDIFAELAQIPLNQGELRLVDSIVVHNRGGMSITHPLSLDFRLRGRGQATKPVTVDRHSQIKLEKVFIAPSLSDPGGVRVKMWVRAPRVESPAVLKARDANGKVSPPDSSEFTTDDSDEGDSVHLFAGDVDLSSIKTPQASLEAIFYDGEKWPLSVRLQLRDASGKRLNSPSTPVNLRLDHISTRKTTVQERTKYSADTVVQLQVTALKSEPMFFRSWDLNLGAYIEGQSQFQWWPSNLSTAKTPQNYSFEFPTEVVGISDSENHIGRQISYFISLSAIPKSEGPLWFKDSLRLNDGPLLPVRIQVR